MQKEFYLILDNIRSLENIGSIFRTADALGVSKIYLCGISAKQPSWANKKQLPEKVVKTALGAEKTIDFEYYRQTGRAIDKLKKQGFKIIALEQAKNAIDYRKLKPKFPIALVLGNEVKGIPQRILKKCGKIIYLPMSGQKESLNVSVAFGAAGYHIKYGQ